MPPLTSVTLRWASSASFSSTIASNEPGSVADDAPEARSAAGHDRRQHGHRVHRVVVLGDQVAQRRGVDERHVTREHDDGSVEISGERVDACLDRAARSGNVVLVGDCDAVGQRRDRLDHLVALMPDDRQRCAQARAGRRCAARGRSAAAPHDACRGLAIALFIRVPDPAASTMTASPRSDGR